MKHTMSLKPKLLVSFFLIVSLFSILIVVYNHYAIYDLSIRGAVLSLNRHAEAYMLRTRNYMMVANENIDNISDLFTPESMKNVEENTDKIIKKLKSIHQLSNLFICVDPETFVNITWLSQILTHKDLYLGISFPENAELVLSIVKTDKNVHIRNKNIRFYDKMGNLVNAEIISDENIENYIASAAKRYLEYSQKNIQHKTLLFDISKTVSLEYTKKLAGQGYVHGNIAPEAFSAYFDFSRITEKTALFMIDDQNIMIAGTNIDKKVLTGIDSPSMTLLKKAYEKDVGIKDGTIKDLGDGGAIFTHQGNEYLTLVSKFPRISNLDWKLIWIIPTSDLSVDANQIGFKSMIAVGFMLSILLIWLYFYINRYSQPIDYLGGEAKKIREFDLEDSIQIEGNARETEKLTAEIQNMKTSVKNFSRFIPKGLLEKLVNSGQEIEIGGKLMPVTLFFSDIQGFTTISEGMEPNTLSLHLSDYLEELTGVIAQNNGTIDKYIGDCIMAFWGAPEADENQVENACTTALICHQKIQVLNKYWKAQNKPELVTRIGLHCGDAVIGNMGSSQRLNYTAIGDNVNLAARLEGANKMYGTHTLVSQAIVDKLPQTFILRPVDIVAVKGKDVGVKIFELVGLEGDSRVEETPLAQKKFIKAFTKAFDLYLAREFEKAIAAFEKIESLDPLCEIYIKRCQDFIASPPPENWDGVVHLKEK